MSIKWLLFSFDGRIGRQTFWQWNICYYFLMLFVAGTITRMVPQWSAFVLPMFLLIILVPDLAVTAKRWHDRDKSCAWLLLNVPLVLGRISFPMSQKMMDPVSMEPSLFSSVLSLVGIVCGAWIFIECGFLKGSEDENLFGSAPVSKSSSSAV